ncbi:hypothetical protein [Paenibacillus sp. S150]|uniref:hypothetical protein n=1 Tax=Paenibacillus sp. S150 TaxID=2749826 RepID=UPI001C65B3CB|nr:hypothetical protein [Paenibacillus sp. S150]
MATTKRMVPKLGSIDELLRLSDQSFKDTETPSALEGESNRFPLPKSDFLKTIRFAYMRAKGSQIWQTAFKITAY